MAVKTTGYAFKTKTPNSSPSSVHSEESMNPARSAIANISSGEYL